MASVRTKTQKFQEQKEKLQNKLIDLKKIRDQTKNDFKLAESELKLYLSRETSEAEKLETLKESYEKAEKELQEKKS